MNIYAQVIGLVAIIIWLASLRKHNKKDIIFLQIFSNAFYGIEYLMLGAITATCMNFLSTLRCAIYYNDIKKKKKTSIWVLIIFVVLMIILGIVTYKNLIGIIPTIITCLYAYSLWQKDIKKLYIITIIAALLWLLYNGYVGAYISVIGNIFEIIFASISIKEINKKYGRK